MPTYDYRCEHCGHEFSRIQSFTEGAVETCPNCGKRPTRLMSLPSIVFKGSGWYKTDSRRSPPSEGASSSGGAGASASSDKSAATKADGAQASGAGGAKDAKKDAKKDKPTGSGGASASGGSGGASS